MTLDIEYGGGNTPADPTAFTTATAADMQELVSLLLLQVLLIH